MTKLRELKGVPGESDYDYLNDILFFKVKDREYAKSIELNRLTLDIDEENFIVGIQIFGASEFFGYSKESLRNVRTWQFKATVDKNKLEVRLTFQTTYRNMIMQSQPIIMEELKQPLPDSKVEFNVN